MSPELAIVGAGPAGLTAALAAHAAGLAVTLIEADARPGGQLLRIHSRVYGVEAFAGDGRVLAAELERRLAEAGVAVATGRTAERLERDPAGGARLRLADGEVLTPRALLVASGLRARTLGVPGERELAGRGVSTSATRDRGAFAGEPVVVVGGGDAAFENALLLDEVGCRVTVLVRGTPRAREEFRRRVAARPAIAVEPGVRVLEILGDTRVAAVRLVAAGGERRLETRGVFVKIGSTPNTEWCRDALACDTEGYVRVDGSFAASAPGVWAAGDVARPVSLTVTHAASSAEAAVASILAARR